MAAVYLAMQSKVKKESEIVVITLRVMPPRSGEFVLSGKRITALRAASTRSFQDTGLPPCATKVGPCGAKKAPSLTLPALIVFAAERPAYLAQGGSPVDKSSHERLEQLGGEVAFHAVGEHRYDLSCGIVQAAKCFQSGSVVQSGAGADGEAEADQFACR